MGFPKYLVLVAVTIFFAHQSSAGRAGLIGGALNGVAGALTKPLLPGATDLLPATVSQTLAEAKKNFDIKAAIGGEGNAIITLVQKGIKDVEDYAALHTRSGVLKTVIETLKKGWEETMKLVGEGLDHANDYFESFLNKDIKDKQTALNELATDMEIIIQQIFHSGAFVHASLGAGKAISDYADKGKMRKAIDLIQETGTELFDNLEAALHLGREGIKSNDKEVMKRCITAAHAIIKSAAVAANKNLGNGARLAMEHLTSLDESAIKVHDSVEELISNEIKAIADGDADTVDALQELEQEFASAISQGSDRSILQVIKDGLVEYIRFAAFSVAVLNQMIQEVKEIAKTDPQAAMRVVDGSIKMAKDTLIDGSIKSYEGLGYAGRKTGMMDSFWDCVEIAERSRVEGTKGMDMLGTVLTRGIVSGGEALESALVAAHKIVEANESVLFDQIDKIRHVAFAALKAVINHIPIAH